MVITVAIDRAVDARKWIEQAEPAHPSLIDEAHLLGRALQHGECPFCRVDRRERADRQTQ